MKTQKTSGAGEPKLTFHGGPAMSVLPVAIFLCCTVFLVIKGAPKEEGMILAAIFGISVGLLFARDKAVYSETVFSLMANRIATVAVVCWLWAGAFSGIMAASGVVEAMVWIGWKLQVHGAVFVLAVFISAALFATSVGTGLGTIVGFTAVLYPAGVVLGANPAALMGAIISGAAFGDNVAPISDTTIVSAATQETDVGGVVRSRLKYALSASAIACVLFLIFGGRQSVLPTQDIERLLAENADPQGLYMLIPAAIVFFVAVSGRHFLAALTAGIFSAVIIGPVMGVFPLAEVFAVSGDSITGSAVTGAMGLVPMCIMALLLVTSIGIMHAGGFLGSFLEWLQRTIARSLKGTELAIIGLITFTNICVSVNTVAMITAGPLANIMRKKVNIHPYRCANLLDTVSCSFPFLLPYASSVISAVAVQQQVAARYDFVQVLSVGQFAPYAFYCVVLFPLMIVAVLTGFGSKRG